MKPPPQFGQTLPRRFTQEEQKVHSKLQIHASSASGASFLLRFSQVGRSSSMGSGGEPPLGEALAAIGFEEFHDVGRRPPRRNQPSFGVVLAERRAPWKFFQRFGARGDLHLSV